MNKVKMLTDVVSEVKKEAPQDVPNWSSKFAEAQINLKNQLEKGKTLPKGVEDHPLKDFAFNYSVQRDVRPSHVMNIMKKFDPRVCCPVSAVKRSDGDTLFIFDGQHRAVALSLLGYKSIPVTIVETDEPAFDAEAFEIVNDSGILRAGTEEIHRCLLHRYKMGETETERVVTAHTVQEIFDRCSIDLEPKRVRKSSGKCGPNKHYFSHFDYAYKGIKMAGAEGLEKALLAIKNVYGDEDGGEINQGLFIGLMKQYQMGEEAKRLKRLPDDWMIKMLETIKKVCPSGILVHSAAKKQWQHANGVGWDAPVAMAHLLREVYLLEDGTFEPSYMPNVTLKLFDGDIAPDSEAQTAFNKYLERKNDQ
jgi:hypothetical protein